MQKSRWCKKRFIIKSFVSMKGIAAVPRKWDFFEKRFYISLPKRPTWRSEALKNVRYKDRFRKKGYFVNFSQ